MEISLLGYIIGLLMVIIPICILELNGVKFLIKVLRSFAKMVVFLGLMGLCLFFVFKWNNTYVNLLCVLLMMAFGSLMIIMKSRLSLKRYLLPILAGIFSSTIVVGLCLIMAMKGGGNIMDAHVLIPVSAILIWAMMESNALALRTYHVGMQYHGQLYEYLLGNGATHRQAVLLFVKRAFERVAIPYIKRMSMTVIGFSPIIVWSLLLYGVDIWTAIVFQALVIVGTFCASVLSLYISLLVADKLSFDKYGILKDESNRGKEVVE